MRKLISLATTAFALALLFATAGRADTKLGIGAFAGLNVPVVQDDAGNGSLWGVRGYVDLTPSLSIQPYFAAPVNGDYVFASETPGIGNSTFDGGNYTVFGVDAALGNSTGAFGFQLIGGLASYKLEREQVNGVADPGDFTRVGFSGGFGVTIGLGSSPIMLVGRASGVVIPLKDGGSRKHAFITGGVRYGFGR